jgi:HD-GYP domain-containing protein (c-di-GMP phosphodiesterase class II)
LPRVSIRADETGVWVSVPSYQDSLEPLNRDIPLHEKLEHTHRAVRAHLPFVSRIAVILYDSKTDLLKTYVHAGADDPLSHYQALLGEAPSLAAIIEDGRPRVINDMHVFGGGTHEHTRRIAQQGYAASYTMPMYSHGAFFGFVLFNSYEAEVFTELALRQLDVFGHMIGLLVMNDVTTIRTLAAAVTTTAHLTHLRDAETGGHIDRMSRYARLIARALAPGNGLSDEFVEHVFLYAPLHDIGKIAIPDNVLLKPGGLDAMEAETMRTHSRRGREIIDEMLANFDLGRMPHVRMLRNIVEHHHEAVDGSGYPQGLKGAEIPLEARIVAVADVFDALTSRRPYKRAWTNDEAFEMLGSMAGRKFDAECVAALIERRAEVERIQAQFREDPLG